MILVYVLCEGPTEETFVNQIISPYLETEKFSLTPIVLETSPGYKGGISSYEKIKKEIQILNKNKTVYVTTFIDYYGLPKNFPGKLHIDNIHDLYHKIQHIEDAFKKDINDGKFIPYIMLHEFEALLFSDVEKFYDDFRRKVVVGELHKVVKEFCGNPELINGNYDTVPSRRIEYYYQKYKKRRYQKVTDGILMAQKIGLDKMREKCKHFNEWLICLEALSQVSDLDR